MLCNSVCGLHLRQIINSRPQNFGQSINGGGWNKSGGLEKLSKSNNRGDDYTAISSIQKIIHSR